MTTYNSNRSISEDSFVILEDFCSEIIKEITNGRLKCNCIYLINYYKDNDEYKFHPSLTAKVTTNKLTLYRSSQGILRDIDAKNKLSARLKISKSIIEEVSNDNGLRSIFFDNEEVIFLLDDTKEDVKENNEFLANLAKRSTFYRENSLNSHNDSTRAIHKSIKIIRKKYSISKEATLKKIILYLYDEYPGFVSTIHIYKYNYSSDEWSELSGMGNVSNKSNSFVKLVNRKSREFYYSKGNSYDRVPINGYDIDSEMHYILVPFVKERKFDKFKYLIFISSEQPISKRMILELERIILDYYTFFIETEKKNLLFNMQSKLFEGKHENGNNLSELRKHVRKAFSKIVYLTNAYSATMRLHNPFTKTLRLFVDCYNRDDDGRRSSYIARNCVNDISIDSNKGTSVNCITFLTVPDKKHKYVKNLNTKANYLKFRDHSMSELCIPIFYKSVKIGVINFESPMTHGFDEESDQHGDPNPAGFLTIVKQLIEQYFVAIYDKKDIRWSSNFIVQKNHLHDLKQIIDGSKDIQGEDKKEMLGLICDINKFVFPGEGVPITKLLKYKDAVIDKNIQAMYDEKLPQKLIDLVSSRYSSGISITNFTESVKIDEDRYLMLQMIYGNLLSNIQIHSDIQDDRLSVTYNQKNKLIRIRQKSKRHLPNIYNDIYFEEPIPGFSEETHQGLFIIGVLTRQLSGYIYLDKKVIDGEEYIYGFEIRIPLSEGVSNI